MQTSKSRITKRTVDAATPPSSGERRIWDTDIRGFFLRVYPTGRRVYALKYRSGSLQRIFTIGTHGSPLTPETARDAAKDALERVRRGEDPADEKQTAREALSVGGLIDRYLAEGPSTKLAKRQSSWLNDASNLNRHIRPLLGPKLANSVSEAAASRTIAEIAAGKTATDERTGPRGRARVTGGEGVARRTATVAAAMFAWGVRHKRVIGNPFAGLELPASPAQERFLSRVEIGRLLDTMESMKTEGALSATFADALLLLLLTGARKTEVLGLQWPEVDLEGMALNLPPKRTKSGGRTGGRRVHLSAPAVAILSTRQAVQQRAWLETMERETPPATATTFVFPAHRGDGHAKGLWKAFKAVRERAGLADVRPHDLRHSFASLVLADGGSLFLVSKLLGHADTRSTERYAHLSDDPQQAAAARAGGQIMGAANGHANDTNAGAKAAVPAPRAAI
jgi:integrase